MPKFSTQFYPTSRLPIKESTRIQKLVESFSDAPIPETLTNSLIFIPKVNDQSIGFASVTVESKSAQITSLFIHPTYRRKLLGLKLMLDMIDKLSKTGCQKITLKCSETHLRFFKMLGFVTSKVPKTKRDNSFTLENPCPEYFLSTLKKTLRENEMTLEQIKFSPPLLGLGDDNAHYQYSNKEHFLALHRNMLSQAQKQIWLMSDTIISPLLSDEVVRDSLLRLSKRNAKANIRILLEDDKVGAGHYSPTIELAQKLTSFIEIRAIPKGVKKPTELITCVDFNAGIFRKDLSNYAGFAHYNNQLVAERLRDKFEQHWQYAKPSLQLRRLSI